VIYDPELTYILPAGITAASGVNAIAHAVEALYAEDANPVISLMAEEGIRALAQGLPRAIAAPRDAEARSDCLYGAWLCGTVLGNVGMALHHKLCHVLGGSFNLPHAETHTIVLPHAAAYNRGAAPDAMRRVARALGAEDAPAGLYALAQRLGTPLALKDIGMPRDGLDKAAQLVTESPYYNPRPIEYEAVRRLLEDAYHGRAPG
jgi:maleylacetate reductase